MLMKKHNKRIIHETEINLLYYYFQNPDTLNMLFVYSTPSL